MKHVTSRIACFGALFLLSAAPREDQLRFAPAVDADLSKSFETKIELVVDDVWVEMDGQEMDPAMMGMGDDLSVRAGYRIGVSDVFAKVEDGLALDFTRTFESIETWYETPEDSGQETVDEIEGKTVRFVWNAEDEEYERSFVDDEEADEEELEPLAANMDLQAMLPPDSVEQGDEWEVEGLELMSVVLPGFDVRRAMEMDEDAPEAVIDTVMEVLNEFSGTCKYEGLVEEDGVEMASISFKGELNQDVDLDASALGMDDQEEVELQSFIVQIELQLEGSCLWNQEAGRFQSVELAGEGAIAIDAELSILAMGAAMTGAAEISLELAVEGSAD